MKEILRQIIVFLGVGVLNTATTLGIIFGLIYFMGLNPLWANFLGYGCGLALSFTLNRRHTFKDQGTLRNSAAPFLGAAAVAYLVNLLLILLSERHFGVGIYLSQIMGNIGYTGTFFVLCRVFVFKSPRGAQTRNSEESLPARPKTNRSFWLGSQTIYLLIQVLFIAALTLWLSDSRGFNPLDDHQFARTLFQGKPFGAYFNQALGRFYPLVAQEYVLTYKGLGHPAGLFYRMGLIKLAVLAAALSLTLSRAGLRNFGHLALWLVGIVSYGVAGTLFRLHAGDLNAAILLLFYVWLLQTPPGESGPKASDQRRIFLTFGLALWASLYKESIVVLLFCLSGLEVLRLTLQGKPKERLRHLPVLIYTMVFLVIYALWAGHSGDANYAASHQSQRLTVLLKTIESNPEFLLLFLPLLMLRIATVGRRWSAYTFYDSLLVSGLGYAGLFLILGMWNQYYLYPGMVLALAGSAGLIAERLRPARALSFSLIAFLLVIDNAPAIYAETRFQHDVVTHHGRMIDYLKRWAPEHCAASMQTCVFVMEGVSPRHHSEVVLSLESFLIWSGASKPLVTEDPMDPDEANLAGTWAHLTRMASKGNYVVVNPYRHGSPLPESPSLTPLFAIPREESLAPPVWRGHEWLWRAQGSEKDFDQAIKSYSRFTGYALYEKTRDSLTLEEAKPLIAPQSEITASSLPETLPTGAHLAIKVAAKNLGEKAWLPSSGRLDAPAVYLLARWFKPDGTLAFKGEREALPEPILPGETVRLPIHIELPLEPGPYRLELTAFQEGVQWIPGALSRMIDLH
jgi:putative flippase GtrA